METTAGLFKYFDPSKLDFFEKGLLLLTPPIYMNDPWDFRPKGRTPSEAEIRQAWLENESEIAPASVLAVPADFLHRQRQERLEMMRADAGTNQFLAEQGENYQREIGKVVGLTCFTEKPLCRLMWAHYGQSHAGFVAEFDADEQFDQDGFDARGMGSGPVAVKVKYLTTYHQQITEDASNILAVLCTKHRAWDYEAEWRVIAPLARAIRYKLIKGDGERFCVPFKPGNLRRVIFGMRMNTENKKRLLAMLAMREYNHVRQETTNVEPDSGELVLGPI